MIQIYVKLDKLLRELGTIFVRHRPIEDTIRRGATNEKKFKARCVMNSSPSVSQCNVKNPEYYIDLLAHS